MGFQRTWLVMVLLLISSLSHIQGQPTTTTQPENGSQSRQISDDTVRDDPDRDDTVKDDTVRPDHLDGLKKYRERYDIINRRSFNFAAQSSEMAASREMDVSKETQFLACLELLWTPPSLGERELEAEQEADRAEELKEKIWKDLRLLKQIKERSKGKERVYAATGSRTDKHARRKRITHAQNAIFKRVLKMMEDSDPWGFVYGIITDEGTPVSGVSDNLHKWWEKEVRFNQNGPKAMAKYHVDNSIHGENEDHSVITSTPYMLLDIQPAILSSLLSELMKKCHPPQKRFPFEKGLAPPWWPTGDEEWWSQLGVPPERHPPPYKKPHDLKKVMKVGVLMAVIRHLYPGVAEILKVVMQSESFRAKMTTKDAKILRAVIKQEEAQVHPNSCSSVGNASGLYLTGDHNSDHYDIKGVENEQTTDGADLQRETDYLLTSSSFPKKRKQPSDEQQQQQQQQQAETTYPSRFHRGQDNDSRLGFQDQINDPCHPLSNPPQTDHGVIFNIGINNPQTEPLFTMPSFGQPTFTTSAVFGNQTTVHMNQAALSSYDGVGEVSGLRVPAEYGFRMSSDAYIRNTTAASLNSGVLHAFGDAAPDQNLSVQLNDGLFMRSAETNMPPNEATFPAFRSDSGQAPYNSATDDNNRNVTDNPADFISNPQFPFTLGGSPDESMFTYEAST